MKQISTSFMKTFKTARIFAIAIIVIASSLTMTPSANAANPSNVAELSFLDSVSELFGFQSLQSLQSPQANRTAARDLTNKQLNGQPLSVFQNNIFPFRRPEFSFAPLMPSYTTLGSPITENFNGIGSSGTAALPADWRFGSAATYSTGVTAATQAAGTSGTGVLTSTSAGGYYNLANGVTASSSDRALGWLSSGTFSSPRQLFVKLTNNTGSTIGSVDIAYDIEKYKSGTRAFTINFFTSTDGTNWTAQTAGDQAYAANINNTTISNPPTAINKSLHIEGFSIAPGADLYLRWSYTGSGGSTNAQALGIDNFSFTPYAAVPGTVQFDSSSYTDIEGAAKTITVNRVGGTLGAISVDYATGGGSATGGASCTAGVDYITASGTLNWADGNTAPKSFNVQLCNDVVVDTESLQLTLSNPVGTAISGTNPVALDIIDNPPGTLQFFSSSSNADENLPTAGVPVSRTGGSSGSVSADYAVTGGTAAGGAACTAGVDYITPAPGTLTWTNGDSADKFIDVTLCTDLITYEGPETVELTLSNAQGGAALGSQTSTTVTINDVGARFINNTQISITGGPASPYPSDINVAGVPGAISDVKVTLIGVTHTFPDDIDVLLVSPSGRSFLMMSDVGDNPNLTNRTFTFSDSAASFMPNAPASAIASGTYKPTNYDASQLDDLFDAPAPAAPYFTAGPEGSDTFATAFSGTDANGTWSLYVRDAFPTSDNGAINAGWFIDIKTTAPGPGTVEFSAPSFSANEGATATVGVKRVTGGLGTVSVDYATGGGTATGGASCGAGVDYVSTSGTLTWGDSDVDAKSFTVQLCSDSLLAESTETIDLTLSNPVGTTISGTNPVTLNILNNDFEGTSFSNPAAITIPNSGAATPYPSQITVSGMTGNISDMRVKIYGLSHTYAADVHMLLVGPGGQSFVMYSGAGGGGPVTNATFTLRDSAASFLPEPIVDGTYKPTSAFFGFGFDPPAPVAPYPTSGPASSDSFMSVFGGANPNGPWKLYVMDGAGGDEGQIAGGWSLDIATAAPTPGTVEFSSASFNGSEGSTATITANRVGGTLGAVSVDYATISGTAVGAGLCEADVDFVNISGTLNWADGNSTPQTFTVSLCSDAEIGETSETVNLLLFNPVGTAISGTNPATLNIENNSFAGSIFSNPAPITIPTFGTATPYPSTITISGMTGAVTEVRMVIKDFSHTYTSDADLLLVGPQGQKFVVMSDVGSNTPSNNVTLTLRDSAADNMTAAALSSGSYKPTDIPAAPDSWADPAPSGPYSSPAPWGASTFASVFGGSDPNGVWSLYVRDQFNPDGGAIAGGWELQIATAETVRFNPGDYITNENAGTVSLQVVRPSSNYAATVDYTLGSAGALYPAVGGASCDPGIDYINTPGTLNFGIGELSKNIDITLCDDGVFDGLKIILPELSNPTGGMILGSPGVATVFINDDETAPTISISDVTVNESAGTASFVVTQSFVTNSLTQFLYSTSDGSALAGFDYTGATNAAGNIPAGETTANIVIPIMNDSGFEETETFNVALTSVVNATPADPAAVGTITDDDTAASYVVTTTNNSNDGTCDAAHCSLREAIIASNSAPGIITFAPGVTGTITFSGSRPQITNNVVINGPGADVLAVSGNNVVTVFEISGAGTSATIRGLTIRNGFNLDFGQGGAITNGGLLAVENSVITASRGNFAGAIQTYGPLTVRNSTLSNNIGGNDGMQPGCSSIGGAIDSSNEVTINISSSTITGNSVSTNCSANSGAINLFAGRVMVTNSTITNNTSSNISAAIGGFSPTTSVIRNSIIAGNTGDPSGADVQGGPGAFASEGFNIIGNPGAVTEFDKPTDQVGSTLSPLDPMLGALGGNGGTTPTHLPLAGSPTIDKGKNFGSTTDQRGSARPSDNGAIANAVGGDGSDIGAVEVQVPATIQFSSAAYSDSETNADHTFNIVVQRFGGNAAAVSVDYTVTDGSATTADNDYEILPASGTLNWASGDSADKFITVTVKGDIKFETDETINLALSNVTGGAALGSPPSAVLSITNDDGQPTISVDDTVFGGDTLVAGSFTVSLSNPSSQTVTVHYATADDTAIDGQDYTATSGTVTFDPGETSKTVPVSVLPNTTNEATEQFFLNLDTPTGATIADGQGIGYIFDDDPFATVAIDNVTHSEGNSGTTSYTFTVTKVGDTAQTISVDYSTFNGAAVSPSDFTGVSGTLTFLPAEFVKTITVDVNGDTSFESDEIFYVRLSNAVAVEVIDHEGVGTITNDDAPTVYIVNSNNDVDDGTCDVTHCSLREAINWANSTGGHINFAPGVTGSINLLTPLAPLVNGNAIVINGPGANVLTVKRDSGAGAMRIFDINGGGVYTINGLAINDGDVRPIGGAFNNLGGAIRILNGRGVTINNCTFTNNWANNGAAIYNGANPATNPLTVNNSTFTANNANQSGGGIENRFSNTVTVNHSTFDANGAPFFGGGIHNLSNGVVFVNDSLFTGNAANSGAGIYNDDNGSITINRSNFIANHAQVGGAFGNKDGGMDFFNSTLSGNTSNGDGGAGSNRLGTVRFFSSTLSGNTSGNAGGAVYFTFEGASNGTFNNCTIVGNHAGTGGGIMVFNGQSIVRFGNTIMAGNTALTQAPDLYGQIYSSGYNIFGKRNGNGTSIFNEQPTDIIGTESSPVNPMLGLLVDNGGPTKTHALLPGSPALNSGNAFGETTDQRGFNRTVNGTTDRGAFEVQNAPASLATFSGTPQSATVGTNYAPLQARVTDSNGDPVGGVSVTFNAPPSGASGTFPGGVFSATATTDGNGVATAPVLTANNTAGGFQVSAGYAAPPAGPLATFDLTNIEKPMISVDDVTFTGADSLAGSGFTVTLSAPSASPVTVHYQTADGTAIAGEDYTATSGTLTFDPGETSKPVPVTILADNVQEDTEQFYLNLDSPGSNAVIADGQGIGTIPNDDAEPTFAIDDVTMAEGNSGTTNFIFTITKTGSTTLSSTVSYTTNNGSATAGSDFTGVTDSVVFLANETTKQVTVNVSGDISYENHETFTLDLTSATNGTFTDNSGLGTITNDDAMPAFSIDDVTMAEGNAGTAAFTFTVTRTGATGLNASVDYATTDSSAAAPGDYAGVTGSLTFLPNETSKQITINVNGEVIYENDETFTVGLTNASNATISDGSGLGTITNDDSAPAFSFESLGQEEGNATSSNFVVRVTKTGATELNATVDFATVAGTATANNACGAGVDYITTSGTLTFLPADTIKPVTIEVCGDTIYESNETFTVPLSNPAGAVIGIGQGTASVEITNDDSAPTLSIDDHTFTGVDSRGVVSSGFTVTLNGGTELPVTVHYQSADGTAVAGEDYNAVSGTLTFNPGETAKPIPVTILPDTTQENTEQFVVNLDTPTGATIADGQGVGTIPNDDAGPAFAVDDVTHSEGNSGTTSYTFTITKTGSTALSSNITFTTQDGSATSPEDYSGVSGNVIFGPSETTKQVTVLVNGEISYESDEAFTLHLVSTDNGSISDADGTGAIVNDDVPASVQLSAAAYVQDESQSAVITVTRTGDTTGTTTVNFATSNGTAIGNASCTLGTDYISTSGTVTFNPNDLTQTVNVAICADVFPESVDTINLTLSGPNAPAILGTQSTAVLSINDTAGQFRGVDPITIGNNAPSNPYPATINVTGAPASSGSVRVTLYDVTHDYPEDLDILLVSPAGQKFILMGNAGGGNALDQNTITFADTAGAVLPDSSAITTGKYESTNWVTPVANFVSPAPTGPYSEPGSVLGGFSLRNVFGAFNPNGAWSLYVRDRGSIPPLAPEGTGAIAGGWGLEFIAPTTATADISGRILTADGRPIVNVRVILSGGTESRDAYTGQLGYYSFTDLPVGHAYVVTVKSRRFFFANPTRLITLNDTLTSEDFVAEPQE